MRLALIYVSRDLLMPHLKASQDAFMGKIWAPRDVKDISFKV